MPLHADQHGASRMSGDALMRAKELALLTNQNVADATTLAGLQTIINAASTHADQQPIKRRITNLMDIAYNDGTWANTPLQAATTISGLAGLTQANVSGRTYGAVE